MPCACNRYRTDGRHVARYDAALDCRECWGRATIRKENLAAGGDGRVRPVGPLGPPAPPAEGGAATPAVPTRAPAACPLLGEATGEAVRCPTCTGVVHLKVYRCGILGTCTLGRRAPGVPGCCDGCTSRPTGNGPG